MVYARARSEPMLERSRVKLSRVYLEEVWLPRLGASPPLLDVGRADYTVHYATLARARDYVTVDVDPARGADLVADVTSPSFVERARALHPEYGTVLFNGVVGYGVNDLAGVVASVRHFHALLRRGGELLVGWNEWDIDRTMMVRALAGAGFENVPIDGHAVFEPPETPGYERLRHRYTHWRKT